MPVGVGRLVGRGARVAFGTRGTKSEGVIVATFVLALSLDLVVPGYTPNLLRLRPLAAVMQAPPTLLGLPPDGACQGITRTP